MRFLSDETTHRPLREAPRTKWIFNVYAVADESVASANTPDKLVCGSTAIRGDDNLKQLVEAVSWKTFRNSVNNTTGAAIWARLYRSVNRPKPGTDKPDARSMTTKVFTSPERAAAALCVVLR